MAAMLRGTCRAVIWTLFTELLYAIHDQLTIPVAEPRLPDSAIQLRETVKMFAGAGLLACDVARNRPCSWRVSCLGLVG